MMEIQSDLVSVLVPRQHLARVYGFVAQLDAEAIEGSSVAGSLPMETKASTEWTPGRIRIMVDQTDAPMRAVLKALATQPTEWLSTKELAKAVGKDADWNTIAGMLGAFGRRCTNRYGLETKPFERKYEHGVGKVFRMPREIADSILRVLND